MEVKKLCDICDCKELCQYIKRLAGYFDCNTVRHLVMDIIDKNIDGD